MHTVYHVFIYSVHYYKKIVVTVSRIISMLNSPEDVNCQRHDIDTRGRELSMALY